MTTNVRDIGIGVNPPKAECKDPNCPFHGSLSVRGQVIEGTVASIKMDNTIVVERNSRYSVHAPACFDLKIGDSVKIMECRPLSKTVSFVVVEKRE